MKRATLNFHHRTKLINGEQHACTERSRSITVKKQ